MSEVHLCDHCHKKVAVSKVLICDFCGRSQNDVRVLVAGGRGADICAECVGICVDTIAERDAAKARNSHD